MSLDENLLKQLEEDLQLLSNSLSSTGPLPLANIRVTASAVCRKWLLDRHLAKICHEIGVIPTLATIDTEPHVRFIDGDGRFNFYTAGGVSIDGRPINSIYAHMDERPKGTDSLLPVPKVKLYTISKFLARKCTFIEGNWTTNEDVLRYVSNKEGGVHYDATRDKFVERLLDRAKAALWIGDIKPEPWPHGLEVFLQVSNPTGAPWNCTHIEMCAIAQGLLNLHIDGQTAVHSLEGDTSWWRPISSFLGAIQRLVSKS